MAYNLNSFCPEPWSQIEIDAEGDYKICCLANYDKDFGMALDENNKVMNVMTHSIVEALNSETHKKHREELSKDIKPRRCRNCYDAEDSSRGLLDSWGGGTSNGRSRRQRILNMTAPENPEYMTIEKVHDFTNKDFTVNSKVVHLDLRFGNLCNQKCIMCSPQHSSLWYKDWAELNSDLYSNNISKFVYRKGQYKTYELSLDGNDRRTMNFQNWWETDLWWERFDEIAPSVKQIYFTGGEPIINETMELCLDKLIEKGFHRDIHLRYDTNCNVIKDEVLRKIKMFKAVTMCCSVDDTEDRYNLIRNPGNFNRFVENVELMKSSGIDIAYLSSCIGTFTPYAMTRVNELTTKLGVTAEFRFLEGPKYLDIRYLPASAKKEIITNLEKAPVTKPRDALWYKVETNLLNKYMDVVDTSEIQKFAKIMNKLDNLRRTDWKRVLPDVVDLIERHCPDVDINQ